jgi:hypothetical protein
MKPLAGAIGARGLALLVGASIVGLALAVHGWSHRGSGAPGSLVAGATSGAPSPSAATTSPPAGPTAGQTYGPAAPSASPATSPGPLLTSQPYASYAFAIWPDTPSSAAKAALVGLSVTVHRQADGVAVTAAANRQPGTTHFYPAGRRVFVVEAAMGDDSGSSDYNLGDDGIVVTDASGRIIS